MLSPIQHRAKTIRSGRTRPGSIGASFEFERTGFSGVDFEVQASPKPSGVYCAEMMAGTQGKTRDFAVRRGAVEEGRGHDSPNTPLSCTAFRFFFLFSPP